MSDREVRAGIRLQRFLAQAGVAARRKAEQLIVAGAVKVNGKIVTELGTRIDPTTDQVVVHGESVAREELFYCVLNKPKGCVTAVSDPHGRRTVMEYLPNLPSSVVPVGRLDYYSEGVLLLTNDGELAAALLSPRQHVEKTYHVKLKGPISDEEIDRLRRGVKLAPRGDERPVVTRPAKVDRLGADSKHDWLVISLTEGKSRQIHRMAEALGHEVLKLQRVAFAGLTYHGLRVGDARELTQGEVNELRAMVDLPRSERAAARGKWRARREDTDMSRRARQRARDEATAVEPVAEPRPGRRDAKAPKGPSRRSDQARKPARASRGSKSDPKPGGRPLRRGPKRPTRPR